MRAGAGLDADPGRRPGRDRSASSRRRSCSSWSPDRSCAASSGCAARRPAASTSRRRSRRSYGGQRDGPLMDQCPVRHPDPRARLPAHRLPRSPSSRSSRRSSCALAAPIAFGGAVRRHVRALGRRQHRDRGHDARARLRRLVGGVCLLPGPGPGEPGRSSASTPTLLIGARRGHPDGHRSCRSCTPGCRISVRADQIISGTIINIAALGMTGYLNLLLMPQARPTGAGKFSAFEPAGSS